MFCFAVLLLVSPRRA